ncbi:MAG: hypothetical protein V7637_3635 [Mycobacteriales bacterium]|jgi:hypothetical protein
MAAARPPSGRRHAGAREPVIELDPAGGEVVVTRFECPGLPSLLLLLVMHLRLKRDVRRRANGFLGARPVVDWRRRTLLSVSLWTDLESIYSMGGVPRHVSVVRIPHRLGIRTACGVFCFGGDWRRVMFGGQAAAQSPLHPLPPPPPAHPAGDAG